MPISQMGVIVSLLKLYNGAVWCDEVLLGPFASVRKPVGQPPICSRSIYAGRITAWYVRVIPER